MNDRWSRLLGSQFANRGSSEPSTDHKDRDSEHQKHQHIIKTITLAINNINAAINNISTADTMTTAAIGRGGWDGAFVGENGLADFRPIRGLYSTNRAFVFALRGVYMRPKWRFCSTEYDFWGNRGAKVKNQSVRAFWGGIFLNFGARLQDALFGHNLVVWQPRHSGSRRGCGRCSCRRRRSFWRMFSSRR
jgi:hypothetical protein